MGDSDRLATFTYLARELGKRRIAFVCAREALGEDSIGPQLKKAFGGVWIANERFDKAAAEAAIAAGEADAVAFGKAFIANPDLPRRLRAQRAAQQVEQPRRSTRRARRAIRTIRRWLDERSRQRSAGSTEFSGAHKSRALQCIRINDDRALATCSHARASEMRPAVA